ncbi:MAG: IS1 family transposase [Syntrophobacteraceae bacterium]
MNPNSNSKPSPVKCPRCNSEAFYKYGKTRHGKQRFRCLLCGRQFGSTARVEIRDRPLCRVCGQKMHVYKKDAGRIWFRCSGYPLCRNFEKLQKTEYEFALLSFHGGTGNQDTLDKG